jgi:hypothetical protein
MACKIISNLYSNEHRNTLYNRAYIIGPT